MATSCYSSTRLLARPGREKPQLSCNLCRKRKLGQASTCCFASASTSSTPPSVPISPATQKAFNERINQLELRVRSLIGELQSKATILTPDHPSSDLASGATVSDGHPLAHHFGRINLDAQESSYVESNHWTAILEEIKEVKDMARAKHDGPSYEHWQEPQLRPGIDLFLLHTYPTTEFEVIGAIPSRIVVDSIVAKYFKTADMPISLAIHRKRFFKQYEDFWENPLETPIMWIAILFGMMYVGAYCTLLADGGLDVLDEEISAVYRNILLVSREKMIQCLRMGNYMKGTPHTMEALLTLLQVEYVQGRDTQNGCWQLIGVIVRVALKMGYHRDGSHFPEMSVFDAEMRRRIWYILMQFDTASASQVGLPRMIKNAQHDTTEPRNLLDDDLGHDNTVLPAPRPPTEHTLSQFLVYKSRVVSVYGLICDFTTSSAQRNYDEAMRLDKKLNEAYEQKPPVLELKPMHRSVLDGAELITRRLFLAISFHHAQMTLHRKFMILGKTDRKYITSHKTCIDAALTVLRLQADIFEQCKPGRMLHEGRWKIWLLVQSEFLLATTILCFDLNDHLKNVRSRDARFSTDDMCREVQTALRSAQTIWKQQQNISKESQTAVKVISFVLNQAKSSSSYLNTEGDVPPIPPNADPSRGVLTPTSSDAFGNTDTGNDFDSLDLDSAARVPFQPSSNMLALQDFLASPTILENQMDFENLVCDEFLDMDWMWDTWICAPE